VQQVLLPPALATLGCRRHEVMAHDADMVCARVQVAGAQESEAGLTAELLAGEAEDVGGRWPPTSMSPAVAPLTRPA